MKEPRLLLLMTALLLISLVLCLVVSSIGILTLRNPLVEYEGETLRLNALNLRLPEFHCVEVDHPNLLASVFSNIRYRCFDSEAGADAYIESIHEQRSYSP